MDMMTTTVSAQRIPAGYENEGTQLPFLSRYETEGSAGIDVFSQDVTIVPHSERNAFFTVSPPPDMVGVVLQYLEERKAHAVSGGSTRP